MALGYDDLSLGRGRGRSPADIARRRALLERAYEGAMREEPQEEKFDAGIFDRDAQESARRRAAFEQSMDIYNPQKALPHKPSIVLSEEAVNKQLSPWTHTNIFRDLFPSEDNKTNVEKIVERFSPPSAKSIISKDRPTAEREVGGSSSDSNYFAGGEVPYSVLRFLEEKSEPVSNMRRFDGSLKNNRGFLGQVKNKITDRTMTELSISTDDWVDDTGTPISFPSMVPTLTKEEINNLAENNYEGRASDIPLKIRQKALAHAKERVAQGLDPFYQDGEEQINDIYSGLVRAETGGHEDPWIRTELIVPEGSSAFGPLQITRGLLKSHIDRGTLALNEEEAEFAEHWLAESSKMLEYGYNKHATELSREEWENKVGKDNLAKYDYGKAGAVIRNDRDKKLYESIGKKLMILEGALEKTQEEFLETWRGEVPNSGYTDRYVDASGKNSFLSNLFDTDVEKLKNALTYDQSYDYLLGP